MAATLHILTRENDTLAADIIRRQREREVVVSKADVVDLRVANPDYEQLLEKIFAADSITVW